MKTVCVVQHIEAEYLGLIEDHFEGRNIRFRYLRPFTPGGALPEAVGDFDALMLLGAGPYGLVSGHILPSAGHELRLARAFLDAGRPVLGLGLGAVVLAVAAGGGAEEAPLRFRVETARAVRPGALGGHLPERFPLAVYLRDAPVPPPGAEILATREDGAPLVFSVAENSLGFVGHPGMKRGMAEDVVMEFVETPPDTAEALAALGRAQAEIAAALSAIMVGASARMGLM